MVDWPGTPVKPPAQQWPGTPAMPNQAVAQRWPGTPTTNAAPPVTNSLPSGGSGPPVTTPRGGAAPSLFNPRSIVESLQRATAGNPQKVMGAVMQEPGHMLEGLTSLPQRAIEGTAQYQPGSGEIPDATIGPAVETALMTVGSGSKFMPPKAGVAPVRPNVTPGESGVTPQTPAKATTGYTLHKVSDEAVPETVYEARAPGKPTIIISANIEGTHAHVEDILIKGGKRREDANKLGPATTRELLKKFRELHPEVETIGGQRISGARHGGKTDFDAGQPVTLQLPPRGTGGTPPRSLGQPPAGAVPPSGAPPRPPAGGTPLGTPPRPPPGGQPLTALQAARNAAGTIEKIFTQSLVFGSATVAGSSVEQVTGWQGKPGGMPSAPAALPSNVRHRPAM